MAVKGYQFNTKSVTVVTPEASTLFMCLASPNDYTGKFGGKLVFTPEALEQEVSYQPQGGPKGKASFESIINNLLDSAHSEYVQDTGKKAAKVPKIVEGTDKNGSDDGTFVMSVANQEQPKILDKNKTKLEGYDTLISNGSTMKAQLFLKPYVMSGKVGVTAYLNTVLLGDIIEYGASQDLFDDDDFDTTEDSNDELDF